MKGFIHAAALLLAVVTPFTSAWSKEDYEIFRLRDEVTKSEGANVTFYSFLDIKRSANLEEINKAYRKLSRTLHPDKAQSRWVANYNGPPSVKPTPGAKPVVTKDKKPSKGEINKFRKEATARFERLSLVTNILRGPERARYDHFLSNGFPAWRGTGYYYERFRPGLGSVLIGLFVVFGGGAHYAALYLTYKRQVDFVDRYIKQARRAAWGDDSVVNAIPGINGEIASPGAGSPAESSEESMQWNRKQKRQMERSQKKDAKNPVKAAKNAEKAEKAKKEGISAPLEADNAGPVGAKKRTVAPNGKVLIVDSVGNVFLEEETEEGERKEFLLDPAEVHVPTIADTFLARVPLFFYNVSLGRLLNKQTPEQIAWENSEHEETEAEASLHSATAPNSNGEARKRKSKARS